MNQKPDNMKQDEWDLLVFVAQGNFPCDCSTIPPKRIVYLCEKWSRKGWLEYGVSAWTGWLELKGLEVVGIDKTEYNQLRFNRGIQNP